MNEICLNYEQASPLRFLRAAPDAGMFRKAKLRSLPSVKADDTGANFELRAF